MSAKRNPLASIADEAIEQIRYSHQHARWLAALMAAIHNELEGGKAVLDVRVNMAKDLASLGHYLADDLAGYSDNRAVDLQQQLDAAEAKE